MDAVRERDEGSRVRGAPMDDRADYCPECGRAWLTTPDASSGPARSVGGWPWLLVVVGMCLLVAYGPRAWASVPIPGIRPALRPLVPCWMGGAGQYYADCDPTTARVGAALGLAWGVAGLGTIASRAVPRTRRRRRSGNDVVLHHGSANPQPIAGLARGIWALADTACRSLFTLLAILVGYVGLLRLVEGVPPSAALVTQAIGRAIDVVALALGSLP